MPHAHHFLALSSEYADVVGRQQEEKERERLETMYNITFVNLGRKNRCIAGGPQSFDKERDARGTLTKHTQRAETCILAVIELLFGYMRCLI